VQPGSPPPGPRRAEVERIDRAVQQVRACRPRLGHDLADELERAASTARQEADLLVAEIGELRTLVSGLDPRAATAELKEAERQRAAVGPHERARHDARVESARQRYVAVHTAWNALDDAEHELADLAVRAEEVAARATALTVERSSPVAGAGLATVTDRIEALRQARAELSRLDPTRRR